jgi:hypothetical protein
MASNAPAPEPAPARRGTFESLADNPQQVQVGLFVLVLALCSVPLVLLIRYGWSGTALPSFAFWMSVFLVLEVCTAIGIYLAPAEGTTLTGADRLRVLALAIAGIIGANAALLGLGLPFTDRLKPIFGAGIDGWRKNKDVLALCGGLFFGGLILMFLGVQLARSFERTRSDLRRVLYGYNAFLSTALLVASLGLINVLAYSGVKPFTLLEKPIDWTKSRMYTLKPTSQTFLASLTEPVKVYILIPDELARREVTTLLENCRAVTNKISWDYVSRDRDSAAFMELQKKYLFRELGVLVVYGTEGKEVSELIRFQDLFADRNREGFQFKGEGALIKTIDYLASGKARAKVYFTQGHGELPVGPAAPGREAGDGMGELYARLGRGNYEPRELRLGDDATPVPDDADVVVIARPAKKFSDAALKALTDYMDKRKGKLFVLFDVVTVGNDWVRTGLEDLVRKYGVQVNEDRVLDADEERNPTILVCVTNPENPTAIGPAFWDRSGERPLAAFTLRLARSVEPVPGAAMGFNAQPLVFAFSRGGVWVEKKLSANADQIAAEIRQKPEMRDKLAAKGPVSLAVTVTEPRGAAGRPNPHTMGGDQQPRLVVFGDSTWVTDSEMQGDAHFALFGACLSWLRERPDVTNTDDRAQRTMYQLNTKLIDAKRLFLQPLGLMVLAVIGLGGAVWVARRR